MEQKLNCETVRDLFPSYIEKITSEASNNSIEEHLKQCEECQTVLEQMNQVIRVETIPEVQNFKKYLNRSKRIFAYTIVEILSCIAVIVCCIVNLAVDGHLSWSLIVDASIVSLLLVIHTGFHTQKHRFIKMTVVTNLCTFGLLAIIQVVLHSIMGISGIWFFKYALPITLLWSAVVWISIFLHYKLKINKVISIAIFILFSIPSNACTNIIANEYSDFNDYMLHFVSNGLGSLVLSIFLFIIGISLSKQKKA